MKNLFKNLMLVAVAAMAFTACSQDVNEVNNVDRVTRYEFTANIADDTRSGFAEKEEGATAYKSEWFGNETLKLFLNTNEGWSAEITAEINTKGQFSFELENAPESFYMTVCSPAESWSSMYSSTIPTEQTPLATSVDPKAHLLQSQATYIQTGSESISMSPQYACYGKMTVNAPEDFVINKVEVSFNGGTVYTLNATHVENNVFWFAVDSMIDVTTFTVTAYDAEDNAITKTVTIPEDRELKFNWGHVSTFSVSGLEVVDNTPKFDIAEDATRAGQDRFVWFMTEDNSLKDLKVNFYNCFDEDAKTLNIGSYKTPANYGIFDSYSTYGGVKIGYMEATVTCKSGLYHIVFENIKNKDGNMLLEKAVFHGSIMNLNNPDPRTKLATPEVNYEINEMVVSLSWNAIENVEYYFVECDKDTIADFTTTETSATITLPAYGVYNFSVTAKVADNNENYKSSDAVNVLISALDPNAWADVEILYAEINDNYVYFMGDDYNPYFSVCFNRADLIAGGIKLGSYSNVSGSDQNPEAGEFAVTYFTYAYGGSYYYGYGSSVTSASLTVEAEDEEYKIILTINGVRCGFKGLDTLAPPITKATIIPSSTSISFGQMGGTQSVKLTTVLLTEPLSVSSDVDQFTANISGDNVVIEAEANLVEAEVTGKITITAGDASAVIDVRQLAYDPNAAIEDGSKENPFIYDRCEVATGSGYFKLTFTSDAPGAQKLYLETNTSLVSQFKTGVINTDNNWYPDSSTYADGTITVTWDESTIAYERISDREFRFDEIKISTFNGYVYYKCESVVFP